MKTRKQNVSSQYIFLFVDIKLRKGLIGVSEDDVKITLEKVMMLFGYLHEKDVFEESITNSI